MKMEDKTKVYGALFLSLFLTAFFAGYAIGYQRGEEVAFNWIADIIEEDTTKQQCKGSYENTWWSADWMKRITNNKSWIYYTENCTTEQISEFIEKNYSYYHNPFDDCYIKKRGEVE